MSGSSLFQSPVWFAGMNPRRTADVSVVPPLQCTRGRFRACLALVLALCGFVHERAGALEPIPEKLVVLTFDDSVSSQYNVVRPILKKYGFHATFFITEGFSFKTNKQDYMTWEQIAELHRDGFEIGNHTVNHVGVSLDTMGRLTQEVEGINARCAEFGIPKPVSFGYPGNAFHPAALDLMKQLGFLWARRGSEPEFAYKEGRGIAFEPGQDHPLLIPTAGDARPDWTLENFKRAVQMARGGKISVIQFHGVPDRDHPWVHTPPEKFEQYMAYLASNGYRVIALRELARYVDPAIVPAEPTAIMERRKANASAGPTPVLGEVVDAATGQAVASRLYIQGENGAWYFPDSASDEGSAVTYQRRNGGNPNALEMHTTLSAHPFVLQLQPGRYRFIAERGKEYLPATNDIAVGTDAVDVKIPIRRWIQLDARHWYSGDTHNHRDVREIPNTLLAEDLNVSFPMVHWTTVAGISPAQSPQSVTNDFGNQPIRVDDHHFWYPRNSEYEIFRTSGKSHTLGAFVVINHKSPLELSVPPLAPVAEEVRRQGGLIDFEKHNWAWSCMLAPIISPDLFELGNNHHWRTEYAVRNWAIPAPAWMNVEGSGTDTERGWTLFGFQTYYALLNSGFHVNPAAGTANGVHPVPMGFSRVYVRVREGFNYDGWIRGLKAGHSFVTTGPMLLATVEGTDPGEVFKRTGKKPSRFKISGEVHAQQPRVTVEIISNGEIQSTEVPLMKARTTGGYTGYFDGEVTAETSGWIAVRCFEERPGEGLRFAHTAPWWIAMKEKPQIPKRIEAAWFAKRVEEEIARNRGVISDEALKEYEQALRRWREIEASGN
jgi:peptidoglycan/xylan/chitin deacetylase (PgdA/CDA1 family)